MEASPLAWGSLALDLPCGRGRNSIWLAKSGARVVAADISERSITMLKSVISNTAEAENIHCVSLNAECPLPFPDAIFDLAAVIHYVSFPLLKDIARALRPGGILIFETYAGHGGNWISLPAPGAVRDHFSGEFDILDYSERLVGPAGGHTAVVHAMARKL